MAESVGSSVAARLNPLGERGLATLKRLMSERTGESFMEHVRRTASLLQQGGPLAHVRFPDEAFRPVLELAINEPWREPGDDEHETADADPPWLRALRRAAPDLASRAATEALVEEVVAVLRGSAIQDPRDWEGAGALTIMSIFTLEPEPFEPREAPLVELVFRAQLAERAAASRDTLAALQDLVTGLTKRGPMPHVGAMPTDAPEFAQAVAALQRDPVAVAALSDMIDKHVDEAIHAIAKGRAPAFMRYEEWLYLTAEAARALFSTGHRLGDITQEDLARTLDVLDAAVSTHLQAQWTRRLGSMGQARGIPQKRRELIGRVLAAVTAEPGRVALALVKDPLIKWRNTEERDALATTDARSELDAKADEAGAWLRSQGLDDTVARLAADISRETGSLDDMISD